MEEKDNLRVMRTKQLLKRAFLELLEEKPIHAVSIRELCKRAGINRTTFYNHYGSQYDLLEDISRQFLESISEKLALADPDSRESVQERVATVLACFEEDRKLSLLLLNNNIDPAFADRIFSLPRIIDLLDAALEGCADRRVKEASASFAVHGSYRLLQEWINREEREDAKEEAALILSLARRVCVQDGEGCLPERADPGK